MSKHEGKTEAPTQKKKDEHRKKGSVAKSPDLSAWLVLLVSTYVIPSTVRNVGRVVITSMNDLRAVAEQPSAEMGVQILGESLQGALFAVMPLLLVCMLIGVVAHFGQTGLVLSLHPLKPDFKRINPIKGLKNLFSMRSLWETGKQIAKGAVIGWLAWPHIQSIASKLTRNGRIPLLPGLAMSAGELVAMVRTTCWAVLVIAVLDFAYKRRERRSELRMTKQEVRDEARSSEGDPQMKGRIRSMQAALSRNRMMSAVPLATVVITNPTHVAIAITYDPARGGAPKVVAAGIGELAARIREKATAAGVPIVEAKPLARALYRACDVGDEIPFVLYEAVAKVLAFIRRLKGGIHAASALPLPVGYDVDHTELDALVGRRNRRIPA